MQSVQPAAVTGSVVGMQPTRRAAGVLARSLAASRGAGASAAAALHTRAASAPPARTAPALLRLGAAAARFAAPVATLGGSWPARARRRVSTDADAAPPAAAAAAAARADEDPEEEEGEEEQGAVEDSTLTAAGVNDELPADHQAFWVGVMERLITLPNAKSMLPYLSKQDPLGVDTSRSGVSTSSPETVYGVTLRLKKRHPRKVVLVRVGEFYEAMGFDAAVLVQFTGLNPMGDRPFKAGAPVGNLGRVLDALLAAGFSVVVGEEAPAQRAYGQATTAKKRFEGGVVTPSSPVYVHGMMARGDAAGGAADGAYAAAPPTLGVSRGARGYTLIEVHADARTFSVLDALPEQALVARLWAAPSAPLYEHDSLRALPGFSAAGTAGGGRGRHEGAALAAALKARPGGRTRYSGDPAHALLQAVRLDLRLADDAQFRPTDATLRADAPRPLFLSAALSLGVVHSAAVPDLLASLLPPTTPRMVADEMRALLLSPPPERVARALAAAHAALREVHTPLPAPPLVPAGKLARLVDARECSAGFLADIASLCAAIQALWGCDELRSIGEALLAPASLATGCDTPAAALVSDCAAAADVLRAVLAPKRLSEARGLGSGTATAVTNEQLLGSKIDALLMDAELANSNGDGDEPLPLPALPREFLLDNEQFRGRVRHDCVAQAYDEVERAARALDDAVREDLLPFVDAAQANKPAKARTKRSKSGAAGAVAAGDVAVLYDSPNNAVWLKAPLLKDAEKWAAGVAPERIAALCAALDRFGRPEKKSKGRRHTTESVDKAAEQYRRACEAAEAEVLQALRDATARLDAHLGSLVAAAQVALYLRLAVEHTTEAFARGWCLPTLVAEDAPWRMEELTPPWMNRRDAATVANHFECNGMILLTGPNMAGKSTVARAAGAAALLANCGLHVPAAAASVPRFHAYYVRMASSDAPSEGLSHWGLDMKEAAALAEGVALGRGTCVMLDELCQGTEVAHATAMAGALLEALDKAGARGIFATHLHGVLNTQLQLQLHNTTRMAMQTVRDATTGALSPTMRLVPGECTESLAFEVAAECGLPQQLLDRAAQLLSHTLPAAAPQPAAQQQPEPLPPPLPRPPPQQSLASTLQVQAPPARTLDEAAALLLRTCASLLREPAAASQLRVVVINPKSATPPPSATGHSAVYALRVVSNGSTRFYVGESDNLQTRLSTHAKTHKAAALEAAYVLLPQGQGAKSSAREVEAASIQAFEAAGFPMLSARDGANKRFGG